MSCLVTRVCPKTHQLHQFQPQNQDIACLEHCNVFSSNLLSFATFWVTSIILKFQLFPSHMWRMQLKLMAVNKKLASSSKKILRDILNHFNLSLVPKAVRPYHVTSTWMIVKSDKSSFQLDRGICFLPHFLAFYPPRYLGDHSRIRLWTKSNLLWKDTRVWGYPVLPSACGWAVQYHTSWNLLLHTQYVESALLLRSEERHSLGQDTLTESSLDKEFKPPNKTRRNNSKRNISMEISILLHFRKK